MFSAAMFEILQYAVFVIVKIVANFVGFDLLV